VPSCWRIHTRHRTQCAANRHSPKLLRNLLDQFNATVPISVPQPGDLVFSPTHTSLESPCWHLHRNGQQINAPTTGQVVSVASVFTGYWGAHYTGHTGSAHNKQRPVKRQGCLHAVWRDSWRRVSPSHRLRWRGPENTDRRPQPRPRVHGAVRLRGCLTPSWRYMQTPMHGRHARNEFCKHACGTLTARLRAPSWHPASATLLGSRLLSARGRGRSNSTAS